jgi:type IV pilus assembly protein PilM
MAFTDMLSQLGSVDLFKKGSALGIDIGSSSVKVVELQKKGSGAKLLKYGTLSLGPFTQGDIGSSQRLPDAELVKVVKTALDAIGVSTKKGGFAIPLKLSLIVTIDVPASAEGNLDTVVPIEARKYIPMHPSEVNLAWSIVSDSNAKSLSKKKNVGEQKIKVLVAAIHNNTVDAYHSIAEKAGVIPAIFEIETFSAIRSVFGKDQGVFALLDIGADASKVLVIDYGSIAVSHTIHRGSQAFTERIRDTLNLSFPEAEKIKRKTGMRGVVGNVNLQELLLQDVDFIMQEAKRVIENFEKQNGKKIEKVALIGGGALMNGALEVAQVVFGKKVFLGNPFNSIELPTPALAPVLAGTCPEFAVACGIALRALNEL